MIFPMVRPKMILWVHLACLILLLSWIWAPTRVAWDFIDTAFFHTVNGWIATNSFSQWFWALSNHKYMDWVHDVFMLGFLLHFIFEYRQERLRRAVRGFLCVLIGGMIILGLNRGVFRYVVNLDRPSPSIVCEKVIRLSEKVPQIHVKDRSRDCYPADHATTAIIFFAFALLFMSPRVKVLSFFYFWYFCLPRLIVGAHWFTDVVMGSLAIGLIPLSWIYGTPLALYCEDAILKLLTRKRVHESS